MNHTRVPHVLLLLLHISVFTTKIQNGDAQTDFVCQKTLNEKNPPSSLPNFLLALLSNSFLSNESRR